MKKTQLIFMALWLSAGAVFGQLQVANIFGNGMVLQQNTRVNVWGKAGKSTVRVSCSWLPGQVFTAKPDAKRNWSLEINTPVGSMTPQQITVADDQTERRFTNVLIGEVWLCSGQSNMEFHVKESGYTPLQTRAADYPFIRHFKIQHAVSIDPLEELEADGWAVCNDSTVQDFSAAAYFFARDLADKYHVPVGLVNSTWGGSQVESWISGQGMQQSELFKNYMSGFPKNWAEADAQSLAKIKRYIFGRDKPNTTAAEEAAYLNPDYDVSDWKTARPTLAWDWQQIWAFRGSGYMVFDFELDEKAAAADALLKLGHGDLPATIYVNGKAIWSGKNVGGLETTIPASVLKTGKNRLLFVQKLGDSSGWVEMGMRGAPEDYYLKTSRGKIALDGKWKIMPSFAEPLYFVHSSNNLGTSIYNAMIHPITRFAIKGVLWYQGETNAIRAHEYRHAFSLLIQDWRRQWGSDFPFLFVQLPHWEAEGGNSNSGSEWAELREAQAMALQLPNTGMAVGIDIGESKDIHPKNKIDVGRRLAHEAFRVAYHEALPPGGALTPQFGFFDNRVLVSFPGETRPLVAKDQYGYVRGFELAGDDKVFHYAKAEISGNTLLVQCAAVPHPVAVRYAWADDPNDVNLYTADGFPVAPLRSDNWKCRTEGIRFE